MSSNFNLPADAVIGWFPKGHNHGQSSDMDAYVIMATELSFQSVDGQSRVVKNGDVVKDSKTLNPVLPQQVVKDYFIDRGWLKEENSGNSNTLSAFSKSYEERTGKLAIGAEFYEALNAHVAKNKNFDYYN